MEKNLNLNGLYRINNNTLQNLNLTHLIKKNFQQLSIKREILMMRLLYPFINYRK